MPDSAAKRREASQLHVFTKLEKTTISDRVAKPPEASRSVAAHFCAKHEQMRTLVVSDSAAKRLEASRLHLFTKIEKTTISDSVAKPLEASRRVAAHVFAKIENCENWCVR